MFNERCLAKEVGATQVHWKNIRACLVAIFENRSGKQFLRTIFKNSFWCFLKKNCVWELNFEKQFLFSKTKKHVWLS